MASSTEPATDLTIPWGATGRLALDWPREWPAPEVFEPDLKGVLGDYDAALRRVLDEPLGRGPVEAGLGAGSTIAIVVDDPSRWTPVREALPQVLQRLHDAGVRPA